MKKKIVMVSAVLIFVVGALVLSYLRNDKKAFDNTAVSSDGKTYLCRRYDEIDRVIAINAKKKQQKKEIKDWSYNDKTGEICVAENTVPYDKYVLHVEGKPVDPFAFILHGYDSNQMPAFVFVNNKLAVENRDYLIDGENLVLTNNRNSVSAFYILWNTLDGASSIGEMTEIESDLIAEANAAWFYDNMKKNYMNTTEEPELFFIDGSDKPQIRMKQITPEEKEETLAQLAVQTYKIRNNKNISALSKEVGFKMVFPNRIGKENTYKRISTLLIESAIKGEITKSVEVSYSLEDLFSENAITVVAENTESNNDFSYLISSEVIPLKYPVNKKTFWTVVSQLENGTMKYNAEQYCLYTWINNNVYYKIECNKNCSEEVEHFITLLLK